MTVGYFYKNPKTLTDPCDNCREGKFDWNTKRCKCCYLTYVMFAHAKMLNERVTYKWVI